MNYVEEVRKIVEDTIESPTAIDAEIKDTQKDESLSATGIADKVAELKNQASELVVAAHKQLLSLKEEFHEAAEKLSLFDGDMLNDDARIIQSGISLSTEQIEHLAERNKDNAFVLELLRKYCSDNHVVATIPLSVPQIIANFDEFSDRAISMLHEPASSLRLAYFIDEKRGYVPEGAERVS